MKILALDLATQLGWAHNIHRKIKYGEVNFENKPWDGCGVRFLKFRRFLEQHKPNMIVYEAVENHGADGTYAIHLYGAWVALIQEHCEKHDILYDGYGVGEIKKFWTGKGNASKDQMMEACWDRGFNPPDHNAADAIAILHLALNEWEDYSWS